MTDVLQTDPSVGHAWAAARKAATAGDLLVVNQLDDQGVRQVQAVIAAVWHTSGSEPLVSAELLHAFTHSNNYVVLARRRGEPAGAAIGFLGQGPGGIYLHSHITGVVPGLQGADVGYALKLHQRAWCLERGITSIVWTFDPLVRRNAYFNLVKLGAAAVSFHPNFYGVMHDGVNAGDESDRLFVRWELDVFPAASPPWLAALSDSAPCHLGLGADQHPLRTTKAGDVFSCDVPGDIALLRSTAPALALEWRRAFRETVGEALADGFRVVGFTKAKGYILGAPGPETPAVWQGKAQT